MRLLIGSTALKALRPDFPRNPKDRDYFVTVPSEVTGPEDFYHPRLAAWLRRQINPTRWDGLPEEAALSTLYTVKLSHIAWDLRNGSWEKHAGDLAWMQRSCRVEVNEELYELLYSIWEERYGKKKVNLNQDYEAFFDDAVKRVYDHDSIHESVAVYDRPMYEQYLDGDVRMDMEKVWAGRLPSQLLLFQDEVWATALERWVIPSNYTVSPRWAYMQALRKTITSLTKGRSSRLMAENLRYYLAMKDDYVGRHKRNIHKLRLFEEKA